MSKKEKANRGDMMLSGRMLAAVKQMERTGISEFEISYDDDLGELNPVEVLWRAEGKWGGHRVFSAHFAYPAQAAEDLLSRVCDGGLCTNCNQRVVIGIAINGFCFRILTATDLDDDQTYEYVRSCDDE